MTTVALNDRIRAAASRLAAAGVASPRHDAEVLAAHALGVERSALFTHPDPDAVFDAAYDGLIPRPARREPLQHGTGLAHSRQVTLHVGPGVCSPRPETELVAGAAVDEASALVAAGRVPVVVDMFAGSGAIALSVAGEVRPCVVHAVESEEDAVLWGRRYVAGVSSVVLLYDGAGIAYRSMSMLLG